MVRVSPNASPGTTRQVKSVATPPEEDAHPNTFRAGGTTWKVGHDYLDTEIGDVCELVEVVKESGAYTTRDPEDCSPQLVFEYERFGQGPNSRMVLDPYDPSGEIQERFIERYTRDPPRGAPNPPW